ncbi:DnaT-like ssDNA-binding domain-containing protein [Flavobacterium sp. W21_SRS_FM6]|uniref:DnaT-like ssDNA-binding domain-containing protein n=1 Tax=Flavobacterium sp. W21_SRS_FM6 TaxID=3240268 RepID=UPI003F928D1A
MNINQAEQSALEQALSNEARVLYLLGLKGSVNNKTGITQALNYKNLIKLLNAKEEKFTLGRQINSLIKELLNVGLVSFKSEVELNHSFNGKVLLLPLMLIAPDDYAKMHIEWQSMHTSWQPNENLLADLAKLMGIIDYRYSEEELGEFISYWLSRPESHFSQFQWTQKFVFNLKRKRLAHGTKNVHKVGQQLVPVKAGIVADDNAKKLVEKYSKTSNIKSN